MERFIAKRLGGKENSAGIGTRPAVIIATAGVALGLFVMIVSVSVTTGFRHQIKEKVCGFTKDVRVTNYLTTAGESELPVSCTDVFLAELEECAAIESACRYVEKAGIVSTDNSFNGVIVKGVDGGYDFSFLEKCLVEGRVPICCDTVASGEILISEYLAKRLELGVGDNVSIYFMQNNVRLRRFSLVGIYRTGFSEYDRSYALTDLSTMQRLNGWSSQESYGIEIEAADGCDSYSAYLEARPLFDTLSRNSGEQYLMLTTEQLNAGLFAWLDLLNTNVALILVLMLGIAGFTIISGQLIIIFERTRTIGVLKALGASNRMVRRIFLYVAARIVLVGMIVGDAIGIGFALLQARFGLIPLNPEYYYVDSVPMELELWWLLLLNAVVFFLSMLMLLGPTSAVSRILPARSIRFD